MPKLDQTQALLSRLIRAPEGAAAALAALPAGALPGGVERWIRGDERLGAVERVDVYANMYFFRLLDCLTEDFPALAAVLGHERFHTLARDYLEAHPSRHPSVRMLGESLGDFLEGHALARECEYLADLARFEWALLGAFDAPDAAPIGAERLKAMSPEDWATLRFELTPSLRIVEARAPVDDVWNAVREGREPPVVTARPTTLRVWREDLTVFHRKIDALEHEALRGVGLGFGAMCERAAALVGEEHAALELARLVDRWIFDRLIVGLD
jgi:putative DNA-binding protein